MITVFPRGDAFYVGTTSSKAERAVMDGLTKPFDVTQAFGMAYQQAVSRSLHRSDPPVILRLDLDERNLEVSDEAWSDPPSLTLSRFGVRNAEAWRSILDEGDVPLPRGPEDWRTSLDVVGWARHVGYVPPDRITVYPLPGSPR